MVRVLRGEYALVFISSIKLGMGASSIASGRRPSKLIINARAISFLAGVGTTVAVKVARGVRVGGRVGVRVLVGKGVKVGVIVAVFVAGGVHGITYPSTVGAGGRELPQIFGSGLQPARNKVTSKGKKRFRMISPTWAFSTRDVSPPRWQFHTLHQRVGLRPCLDLSEGLFPI